MRVLGRGEEGWDEMELLRIEGEWILEWEVDVWVWLVVRWGKGG